jgi:NADPH:quinone reductase-like Zn-dependent oxidoreductase
MLAAVQVGYGRIDESVRVEQVPALSPGDGDVLVRVGGSTLNRKDLFALANLTGAGIRPRPPLPHVNGTDVWGTIAALGPNVRAWSIGDRVVVYPGLYCGGCEWCLRGETSACTSYGVIGEQRWGGHAELVVVPARNLEAVPGDTPDEVLACACGSWLTAWRALVTVAAMRPGETVLVVGASGGVGTAAIRIARLAGCRTIALVGSGEKAARARAIGADVAIDDADGPFHARVWSLTEGRGVDVALDSVGQATWRETIQSLAPFGRMAICGATSGDVPAISIREVYQQHRRILGAPLGSRSEFRRLLDALLSGALRPVVHATLPLRRIHDALGMLERRECFGKVAIDCRS